MIMSIAYSSERVVLYDLCLFICIIFFLLRSWVRKLGKICKCGWIASYKKVGAGHICMRKIHAVCPKGSENKDRVLDYFMLNPK